MTVEVVATTWHPVPDDRYAALLHLLFGPLDERTPPAPQADVPTTSRHTDTLGSHLV